MGKPVLFEDEISVSIPARDLAKKEYLHALNLKNSAEQIISLLDIIEEITTKNHKEIYWSGNLRKWLEKGLKLNLYIDALDEVRGVIRAYQRSLNSIITFSACRI